MLFSTPIYFREVTKIAHTRSDLFTNMRFGLYINFDVFVNECVNSFQHTNKQTNKMAERTALSQGKIVIGNQTNK